MTELDDHELCKKLINRDPRAVDEVVRRYTDMVYRVCLRVLKNSLEAEDAVQSVFLIFLEKAKAFDKDVILEAWLYRTAIFYAQRQNTKNLKRSHLERGIEGMDTMESGRYTVTENLEEKQLSGLIDHAINQLPERYRDVILMHFIGGKKKSDVAESLGLKRSTLSMRLSKGLEKLRDSLSRVGVSTSVSAITVFLDNSLTLPAPSTLKVALQKKLLHSNSHSSTSLTPIRQTHTSENPFLSKPIVALLTLSLALVSAVGYYYASRDSLSNEAKPNEVATATDSSDEVDLHFLFKEGAPDDLALKSGSWKWQAGRKKVGEMVSDQPVFVEIKKLIPKQPVLLTLKVRISRSKKSFWGVGWFNGRDELMERENKSKSVKSSREYVTIETYLYKQFVIYKTDGEISSMIKYEEPYPSDRIGLSLEELGLQELHLKTISESELPDILKDPDLFEKEFLNFK